MAYASKAGRARTSAKNPRAHAICDRCGFRYNHEDLKWQYEYRGPTLQNIRILVCRTCLDIPQENVRTISLPADPVPIMQPRTQDFADAETDYRSLGPTVIDPRTGIPIPPTNRRVTQGGLNRTTQAIGAPVGLDANAAMPYENGVQYGQLLPVISITANGTTIISVTCSAAHGLNTDDQVSIEGSGNSNADGFYSVTVISGTAFSYEVANPIAAGPLLGATTRVTTVIVGIPYGYTQIPKTGI